MSSALHRLLPLLVAVTVLATGVSSPLSDVATAATAPDHLVISELVTGGASASDELIELYNPTLAALPLEGLELIYVSASGLTLSRRAAWELGAPEVPAGGHVLVANEGGAYATVADALYASGMAATGGSVALRIVGAASAIDAVGWGSAVETWREGAVAAAPPAGSSIERLPGGALGSTQDSDDNATDFAVREVPDPQNSGSPPVPGPAPSSSPFPTTPPSPTPAPTTTPQPPVSPSPTPTVDVLSIADARALPDDAAATVEGVALTDSAFTDGGGYVVDASGGVAVLVSGGSYSRGDRVRVSGVVDDRYAQRTLRADAGDVINLGVAIEPAPIDLGTGAVGEDREGQLVRISGRVMAAPTALSTGLAFEIDDGSGPVRLLVGSSTGIDTTSWATGWSIDALGVVGQRDSSGTGAAGYRVQPRDVADIVGAGPEPSPSSSPAATLSPGASPAASPAPNTISVAAARALPKGAAAVVRGVVTLAPGLVDPVTAILQDASGAIVLRIGDEAGPITRGQLIEASGVRSTLAGMETLRITTPPASFGSAPEPDPRTVLSGEAGELHEASLVIVRGAIVAKPRRSTAGTVSFEIDDGSGPLRVSIGGETGIATSTLAAGSWVEVRGPLGQETTGSLPLRGYRIWPRDPSDLRVTAAATGGVTGTTGESVGSGGGSTSSGASGPAPGALDDIGRGSHAGVTIGATLVVGPWTALGIGGLLWDGDRLVALDEVAGRRVADLIAPLAAPIALEITGLYGTGREATTGILIATLPATPGSVIPTGLAPTPPRALTDGGGAQAGWVAVLGRISVRGSATSLLLDGRARLALDRRCDGEAPPADGVVSAIGVLAGDPSRLIVPCGGLLPAPLLARTTTDAAAPDVALSARTVVADHGTTGSTPAGAGLLLLLAAVTLVGGAAAARWTARQDAGAPATDVPLTDEPEETLQPPGLTLLRVPHERAP